MAVGPALPPGTNPVELYASAVRLSVQRGGLYAFIEAFWKDAGEGSTFVGGWYLRVLCSVLEAIAHFVLGNTVINIPPGTGKTLVTTVFWPAWVWATIDPGRRFIFTSYDHDLVHDTAKKFLLLVQAPAFRAAYPTLQLRATRAKEAKIDTTKGGSRMAYQMGGGVTGKHAHHIVCDDPIKPAEAESLTSRQLEDVVKLWEGTFATRRADPQRCNFTIIMQRLNHDDLAGVMLRTRGYEHVCFPMRYVPNCPWDYGCSLGKLDVRTEPGELLCPERYDADAVAAVETALGTVQNVSAQLQQNPVPATGSYFEDGWFREWQEFPVLREMHFVQVWDLGFKGRDRKGTAADSWVHGALWARWGKQYWLIDEVRGHWNYPETKRRFRAAQGRQHWGRAACIRVEDKANGTGLIAEINELTDLRIPVVPVEPRGSKEERAKRHSAKAEAGMIWLPPARYMPSVGEFRAELVRFPHQRANDRVDTTTMALDYLADDGPSYAKKWAQIWQNR
jgi:predicted phage terminase large subunit-like protein